jgi:hypothetical protein
VIDKDFDFTCSPTRSRVCRNRATLAPPLVIIVPTGLARSAHGNGDTSTTARNSTSLPTLKLAVAEGPANYARINLTQANRHFKAQG